LVDGGIVQQIAIDSAIAAGASHILVLMTRREGELERIVGSLALAIEAFGLRLMQGEKIAAAYKRRNPGINRMLEFIKNPPASLKIDTIVRPADSLDIDRLTTSAKMLIAADHEAQRAVFGYLDRQEAARNTG
jgi:predicted patatin/cPLA2 family phospholipase